MLNLHLDCLGGARKLGHPKHKNESLTFREFKDNSLHHPSTFMFLSINLFLDKNKSNVNIKAQIVSQRYCEHSKIQKGYFPKL